ncbi:MAG: TonB-dependent receptor, partial [Rikenellaceae bacterium]|nr:TonB-dependent receptor [Rikenellaceae bacterium]
QTRIDIVLAEDALQLEDVVVIGYGTVKRRDLTGSVASVTGEDIASAPVANAAQALQGRVAGVNIITQDGRPDASIKIRVRGGGSITQSNDPLFIVDGFPTTGISDIPASQIESIDILKDASSTAIYGARGANGVVIVTTKSPQANERVNISYDGYFQYKTLASDFIPMMDAYDYVQFNWEYNTLLNKAGPFERAFGLGNYMNWSDPASNAVSNNPNGLNAYKDQPSTNWQKEIFRSTFAQSHNITVSGGTQKTKYSLSYNYVDDDAIKIDSWYKRTNVLAKLSQELAKGLTLDADARFSDMSVYGDGSYISNTQVFNPATPLGDFSAANSGFIESAKDVNPVYNPVNRIHDRYNLRERKSLRATAALSWEIIRGLRLRTEYGVSFGWSDTYNFTGPIAKENLAEGGNADISNQKSNGFRLTNTLNYDVQDLGDDHRLSLLVGQELIGSDDESQRIAGENYPQAFNFSKAFAMMNQAQRITTPFTHGYGIPERMASFFGRVNYTLKDRYLFTATLRADGSSKFAPENRWGYFPAGAFAWRISEESFMKNQNLIDNLKLRLSYGEAGNDRIGSGLWKQEWAAYSGGYSFMEIAQNYYAPASGTTRANPNLRWETTVTRNAGLDFSLWKNRLYGTIDVYWNTTRDLLIVQDLPPINGYTTQMANIGQTSNRGVEVTLGGDIVRKKDWRVSANFNIGFNKSKIDKLDRGMSNKDYTSNWASNSTRPQNDYSFIVGQQVGMIRGYITDGFYVVDDFNWTQAANGTWTARLKDGIPNAAGVYGLQTGISSPGQPYPGALKLKKLGSTINTISETEDASIIGNTNPKHTGGFNVNASYKNFDLLLGFNWSYGNDIYNAAKLNNSTMIQRSNINSGREFADRYKLYQPSADGKSMTRVTDPEQLRAMNETNGAAKIWYPYMIMGLVHTYGIEDGSFLRLNNVTLGYTLPQTLTKKAGVTKLRVYATVYNAWLWTNYTGYDPEVDSGTGRNNTYPTPGMDWGTYPRTRTYTFGININF